MNFSAEGLPKASCRDHSQGPEELENSSQPAAIKSPSAAIPNRGLPGEVPVNRLETPLPNLVQPSGMHLALPSERRGMRGRPIGASIGVAAAVGHYSLFLPRLLR